MKIIIRGLLILCVAINGFPLQIHAASSKAVITYAPVTQILAGMTRFLLSGMDSYQSSAPPAPSDAWTNVAKWSWDFGDGTTGDGGVVTKVWSTPGAKTVTLTITCRDGSTASTSINVTVAATPDFSGFDKYLSTTGSDSNSGDSAHPWKTWEYAFGQYLNYRGNVKQAKPWSRLSALAGESIPYKYDSSGSNALAACYGPLFVTTYGGSAHATMAIDNAVGQGRGFTLSSGSLDHKDPAQPLDSHYNVNAWDNPIYWDGIDFAFAGGQHDNRADDPNGDLAWNTLGPGHLGSQLSNSIVSNAGIAASTNGGGSPDGNIFFNVEVKGGNRNGVFFSCAYSAIENCYIHDNGSHNGFDNEIYSSAGVRNCLVRKCVLDRGATTISMGGLNCSGCYKYYAADVTSLRCREGWDFPGNTDHSEYGEDVIFERMLAVDCDNACTASYGNRFSLRNSVGVRCRNAINIADFGYASGGPLDGQHQFIHDMNVLNCSFSEISDIGIWYRDGTTGFTTGITIENSIFQQVASPSDPLIQLDDAADLGELTLSNNQYFRTGASDPADLANIPVVGNKKFSDWRDNYSHETGSQYGDPLFVDKNTDLSLQSGSPGIDHGLTIGLILTDFKKGARTPPYEMGAYEYGNGGGSDTQPPTVSITSPKEGDILAGSVTVNADASDNIGVVGVQFQFDGVNAGAEDTSAPYSLSGDSYKAPDGPHTLSAVARDAAGNKATHTIHVVVNNDIHPVDQFPPRISITAPAEGDTITGGVVLSAAASDDVGVVGVQFLIDGRNLDSEDTDSPYSTRWNSTLVTDGRHTITAIARDAVGNTNSQTISISVNNSSISRENYRLNDVRISPNPLRPNGPAGESRMAFDQLPQETVIRIYDRRGNLVSELRNPDSSGALNWDVPGDLAAGIYNVVITGPDETVRKKIAIIR